MSYNHLPYSHNIHNKNYIDKWVRDNYKGLYKRLRQTKENGVDILHDALIKIYRMGHNFDDQDDCNEFMNKYFKI